MKYKYQLKKETRTSENVWLDWKFESGTSASLVRCSATELFRLINIHGLSRPNYHIPPLAKFLPLKKLTTNTCLSCQYLTNLTNACIVTAPNLTEKIGIDKRDINTSLHRRRKMCKPIYQKIWKSF